MKTGCIFLQGDVQSKGSSSANITVFKSDAVPENWRYKVLIWCQSTSWFWALRHFCLANRTLFLLAALQGHHQFHKLCQSHVKSGSSQSGPSNPVGCDLSNILQRILYPIRYRNAAHVPRLRLYCTGLNLSIQLGTFLRSDGAGNHRPGDKRWSTTNIAFLFCGRYYQDIWATGCLSRPWHATCSP